MYKTGKCLDCDYNGVLIAKRCKSCYWKHRHEVNEKKRYTTRKEDKKGNDSPSLAPWFKKQIASAPKCCEECGENLGSSIRFIPSAIIAHIWPKREVYGYPSVATHDQNRMFFCIDCHTNFDRLGKDHIENMRSFELIKHRATIVFHDMTQEEQRKAYLHLDYLINE